MASSSEMGPLLGGRLLPEVDVAACLQRHGQLVGFLSVRRTTVKSRRGLRGPWVAREAIRWRVALDPHAPWDEGYEDIAECAKDLAQDEFVYRGDSYRLIWADPNVARWVIGLILAD